MVFGAETYSVLVVSSQHRFNEAMTPMLPPSEYYPVCFSSNIAAARRELLTRNYDFVIINAPLPDDFGSRLAIDVCTDSGAAALSSRFCAEHYGLQTLQANVQDQDNNYTRFICISKKPEIYPGADRTSFMMIISHKPGSLYNVLSKFYALGINLRKLESRPLPDREFEFMFYFDIESSVYAPEMEKLFLDLESESEEFRYLGTYNEVIC